MFLRLKVSAPPVVLVLSGHWRRFCRHPRPSVSRRTQRDWTTFTSGADPDKRTDPGILSLTCEIKTFFVRDKNDEKSHAEGSETV